MSLTKIGALTLLALAISAAAAAAQEVQVPLDRDGQVQEIDRRLAERLGLFVDEYPDLRVVRLYRADDGEFVLEITYRRDGGTARNRIPMTSSEVDALRSRVSAAIEREAPEVAMNQDGRFLLLGTTTALGLGFYGWAVPVILDLDSARGVLAAYMFTAGASFVLPYLYTRDRPVTWGMANAGFWGATRGAGHGSLLSVVLDPDPDGTVTAALGMGMSLGEGLLGYRWALNTDMTAGRAHTIGNFGDYGAATGGFVSMMTQPNEQAVAAAVLGGSLAGIAVGTGYSTDLPYTWGDAEVERVGFILGAANAGTVFDWVAGDGVSDDEVRLLGALFAAGGAAGGYLTHRALEGHDFSVSQGFLIDLGTVAGGLIGSGVAAVVSSNQADDPTLFFTLGAIGADLGFLATFRSLAGDARDRAERRSRGGAGEEAGSLEIDLNPGALLLMDPRRGVGADPGLSMPLLSVRYRF